MDQLFDIGMFWFFDLKSNREIVRIKMRTIMPKTKRTVNRRRRLLASLGAHGSGKTPACNTGSTWNNLGAGHVFHLQKNYQNLYI